MPVESDFPESVEEAGALLGATITRCGRETFQATPPPKGMHSSFAAVTTVPSQELLERLHTLRALLRSAPQDKPLVSAPSLLAVLMKLLGVSTSLAAAAASSAQANNTDLLLETPPMLSTPCRKLWVDCIVLCHKAGLGLTGTAKIQTTNFCRQMLALAGTNPRSASAAGGIRIAALQVVAALQEEPSLAVNLAPWCLEVLQLCLRALRSIGNGEPAYRVAAVQTACGAAVASRHAWLRTRPVSGRAALVLPGAMEDKAIQEAVKVMRQAVTDKFPEVRSAAATLAAILAPMLVTNSGGGSRGGGGGGGDANSPTHWLDDVMQLCLKNLDDESPFCASAWAEALARCMSTAVQYNKQVKADSAGNRNSEQDADGTVEDAAASVVRSSFTRKAPVVPQICTSLKAAVRFLVDHFIKVGGELAASRAGGTFSVGGRAVRVGVGLVMTKLLRLESELGSLCADGSISMEEIIPAVLEMVGDEMEKHLKMPGHAESMTGPASPLFGSARNHSPSDPGLVRLATNRVIRQGLSEMASEPVQLGILQDLIEMLPLKEALARDTSTEGTPKKSSGASPLLNADQLQVVLIEISHLLAALGEATASKVEDLLIRLNACLVHESLGVRHEAAIACAALTACFPSEGRKLVRSTLNEIQLHHAQIVKMASMKDAKEEQSGALRMFRRQTREKPVDLSLPHQHAIHGRALMVSMLIRELPRLPGGLPTSLLQSVLPVAEILVSCQFNDAMAAASQGGACMCVRAGFGIISGVLTTGPDGAAPHIPLIFSAWQKSCNSAKVGGKNFAPRHDLFCLDSVLSSVVTFLKYCSELLLSIPGALTQTTVMLEETLNLFLPNGRIGSIQLTPPVTARLESATASLLEAFAWLPAGSFPMAADEMFAFAARHIRDAVENEVTCSVLHTLVNREDSLLDSKTLSRAKSDGQVGGNRDVEETVISLTMEPAHHGEREAVLHLLESEQSDKLDGEGVVFRGSYILGAYASDNEERKPPTPLHEVGTWRMPIDPSCSSKVRLVDGAIQAFSSTFGLKSGQEQQSAMDMLESLVPPFLAQLARSIGLNSTLIEQDRRAKGKEDSAAVANITAVLLSCLKSLPLHEATHNVPVGLGPPWMNKAKDLLLMLLPSASNVVRRAAAEGLALLATLGVTEDAHFLQSKVLSSLDEVMKGNTPGGRPRTIALETVSAARAGSLLTLACIQRTAFAVAKKKDSRARDRASNSNEKEADGADNELPLLQMMTRILPSAAGHGFKDYFVVRTYALHSFGILLAYSGRLDKASLSDDDKQLLRKGVELVEDNFSASWTAASTDVDRGQEAEKMTSEISFLAVLLRLMSCLVPSLGQLRSENSGVARRFSVMATVILECHGSHPLISVEAMAFFELLAANQEFLPSPSKHVEYSENPLSSCIPFVIKSLTPDRLGMYGHGAWQGRYFTASGSLRSAVYLVKVLSLSQIPVAEWTDMKVVSLLLASLETTCGARYFTGSNLIRSLAAPRESELQFAEGVVVEGEIFDVLRSILFLERSFHNNDTDRLLRWILFARSLLANAPTVLSTDDDAPEYCRAGVIKAASTQASSDVMLVYAAANPVRWQVRSITAQLATGALDELTNSSREANPSDTANPDFDFTTASRMCIELCHEADETGGRLPPSRLVFHLEDVLASACMSTIATLDQAELQTLQGSSIRFLEKLVACFAQIQDPEEPGVGILEQYSSQIFSSVKHALGAIDESNSEASLRLFLAGCEALQSLIEHKLTTDGTVVKRLIRPTLPPSKETPFFTYEAGYPAAMLNLEEDKMHSNARVSMLARIAKVWTAGKLLLDSGDGRPDYLRDVAKELVENETDIAVHSAAIAIDGARLLLGSQLSLAGQPLSEEDGRRDIPSDCAFLYKSMDDIDDAVKASLVTVWSSCASNALRSLIAGATKDENDEERRDACAGWIKKIVPLLFAGVNDAMSVQSLVDQESTYMWTKGIDRNALQVNCLRGIIPVVKDIPESIFDSGWSEDIDNIVGMILNKVFIPFLKSSGSGDADKVTSGHSSDGTVVTECCNLLRELAMSKSDALRNDSVLLVTLLTPLDLLQNGEIQLGDSFAATIISTCLTAVGTVIALPRTSESLVKAMLQLVLKTILEAKKEFPHQVKDAAKRLLKECLRHSAIDLNERQRIACDLATAGNWDSWAVLSSVDDGLTIAPSLEIVQTVLRDCSTAPSQLAILSVLSGVIQSASIPSPLVGRIFHYVGGDVLATLYQYGTLKVPAAARAHRQGACANSVKLVLIAYQQISSDESDGQQVATFLSILFETLLAILRFNGLPNHPSPQTDGDEALGRMSAQAILHIARTTPVPFKASMASLSDHDRGLLEFAVRAEMTGYVVQGQQAPVKKVLNVRSFKK